MPLDASYNDMKCYCAGASYVYPWGNYVYDITPHIQGSGTYTVGVKRTGLTPVNIVAPGIEVLYRDDTKPLIEYWINEGADLLIGGRRSNGGYLAWWECINNATFQASNQNLQVVNATLGVVSPFGDDAVNDILFFNDIELGRGVYHGFGGTYQKTIDGLTMQVGSTNAQVGVNVSNVTALYQKGNSNVAGQSDDGDNMVPANAFLVVEYTTNPAICGDVNDDGNVNMDDVMMLWYDIANYPTPGAYTISNAWAADVNSDGNINMDDVMMLWYDIANYPTPGAYAVNCC